MVPQVCGTPDLDPKCGSQTARKLKPRSCGVCKAVVEDLEEMLLHKRDTRPDFRTKNHVSAVLEDLCESMGARHPKEEVGCSCSAHALSMLCPCSVHALSMPCPCSVHALPILCPCSAHALSMLCPSGCPHRGTAFALFCMHVAVPMCGFM